MNDIWVISDTHFGHENIIKYCNRPFSSVEEMDEVMVENWNRVVKPQDKVYHLGDVAHIRSRNRDRVTELLYSLNGRKRLIVGNHDDLKEPVLHKMFQKILPWRQLKDFGLLLTHVPVHDIIRNEVPGIHFVNVHGHIHNDIITEVVMGKEIWPDLCYRNVSVEQINYTPINIDELRTK